jgi:hypothetical protein
MLALVICILLIFASLLIAGAINCYALLALTIGSKSDRSTLLGISVFISLVLTIGITVFSIIPWEQINLFLLAGITGIGYTTVKLNKDAKRGASMDILLSFLKNTGIALLIALVVTLIISLLMPKTLFDFNELANLNFIPHEHPSTDQGIH